MITDRQIRTVVIIVLIIFLSETATLANWTSLHESIYRRDEMGAIKEIHAHPEMINQVDSSDWTPLHCAACTGQANIVTELIAHNAKIQDFYDDNTPLHLAASKGHDEIVRILLENGASNKQKNDQGKTPSALACDYNQMIVFNRLNNNPKHQARIESLIFAHITHPRLAIESPPVCHWIVRMICGYLQP